MDTLVKRGTDSYENERHLSRIKTLKSLENIHTNTTGR